MTSPQIPTRPPEFADEAADPSAVARENVPAPGSSTRNIAYAKRKTHFWLRWAHVYTSMVALVITLFFGVTGLTLNHPDWTFGDAVTTENTKGTLPVTTRLDGEVEFLLVSEFLRATHDVKGAVTNFAVEDGEGTISYKNPGYGAEVFFDTGTLEYRLTVQQQGFLAVMNDLHKGRDSGPTWRWVIDISAGFLVLISLTGLGIQLFLRKRRLRALSLSVLGGAVSLFLIWFAIQ